MYANLGSEKFFKKLVGRKDIEDALRRLDRLTQEEALMAAAQILNLTHTVHNKLDVVMKGIPDLLVIHSPYSDCTMLARWKGCEGGSSANVK